MELTMKTPIALTVFFGLVSSQPAFSSDKKFFAEFGVGRGYSNTDLEFLNPVGTAFTANSTSGNYIILTNTDNRDADITGYAALGYRFTENYFAKVSYRDFGSINATGNAVFGANSFEQKLHSSANGFFIGFGGNLDVTESIFLEANVDVGFANIDSKGTQGANLGFANAFPNESHRNFAWGVGAGLGFNLSDSMDLLVGINYHDLGKADTGVTGTPPPNGMNAGEQLKTNLSFTSVTAGIRFSF